MWHRSSPLWHSAAMRALAARHGVPAGGLPRKRALTNHRAATRAPPRSSPRRRGRRSSAAHRSSRGASLKHLAQSNGQRQASARCTHSVPLLILSAASQRNHTVCFRVVNFQSRRLASSGTPQTSQSPLYIHEVNFDDAKTRFSRNPNAQYGKPYGGGIGGAGRPADKFSSAEPWTTRTGGGF